MNISTIAFILIAVFGVALLTLFAGGLMIRSDAHRAALRNAGAAYRPSRVLEDLRPVRDLVVDFVAESYPSRKLLDFLGEHPEPASIIELRASLPFRAERLWTAVLFTSVAGLIRFGRDGITLTDAGHAVRAQFNDPTSSETEVGDPVELERSDGFDALRSETVGMSDRRNAEARMAIGQLRKSAVTDDPSESDGAPGRSDAGPRGSISAADHRELSAALAAARKLAVLTRETRPLQDKLMRARVSPANDIPQDLITMNSRAELVDLDTNERVVLGLVYPADADIGQGRISVFHPLGAAMLGHRVGDEFEWAVPYGTRRFKVAAVQFQPEAALAMAA